MENKEPAPKQELGEQAKAAWPVGVRAWEQAAETALGRAAFDWIAGGAGEEWTIEANRSAFKRWQLQPRVLAGAASRDLSVDILGTPCPAPFLLAPIGGQTVAHPNGERASARAAVEEDVPLILSQAASSTIEDVAAEANGLPLWYQLYWVGDREVVASFVDRAVASGYRTIVLTVDVPIVGWRDRDIRNDYVPFLLDEGIRQYTSDPVFTSRLATPSAEDPRAAGEAMMRMFPNPGLSWDDLAWLRRRVDTPLVIKGLLSPDDALRARDAGFDGYVVSNHGGRQLDGVMSSLDALPAIRAALGEGATVLMDGGIRRGTDVVKALCLGADAVLLGRPYIYGLAVGGEEGVAHVLSTLKAEIDFAFTLVGAKTAGELEPSFLAQDFPNGA